MNENENPFNYRLCIQVKPTNPVNPDCFGVLDSFGNVVAWLTYEQVKEQFFEFNRLRYESEDGINSDRFSKLSMEQKEQEVAATIGYNPNDKRSWPKDLISRLIDIRERDGWESYAITVSRLLRK